MKVRFFTPDAEPVDPAWVAGQPARQVPHLNQVAPVGWCDPSPGGVRVGHWEPGAAQVFERAVEFQQLVLSVRVEHSHVEIDGGTDPRAERLDPENLPSPGAHRVPVPFVASLADRRPRQEQ